MSDLACRHVAWFHRRWTLRANLACFLLADILLAVGIGSYLVGAPLSEGVLGIGGWIVVMIALGCFLLPIRLDNHERGRAGTLRFDGTTISLLRPTISLEPVVETIWQRRADSFEFGWVYDSKHPALELQLPNGNVLLATAENLADARQWLAATGLDKGNVSLRLDDGTPMGMWDAIIWSSTIAIVVGLVVSIVGAGDHVVGHLVVGVAIFGSQAWFMHRSSLATIFVDAHGILVHRFLRRSRIVPATTLREVSFEKRTSKNDHDKLVLTTTEQRLRLRCDLDYYRERLLVERIRQLVPKA